mmetsp:Transcript_165818/g.532451  ORF Transcript_165818/g.532451 Transcript_165818/m.532451 type:complete len:233 (+) Transcript_165818:973-1671(+)
MRRNALPQYPSHLLVALLAELRGPAGARLGARMAGRVLIMDQTLEVLKGRELVEPRVPSSIFVDAVAHPIHDVLVTHRAWDRCGTLSLFFLFLCLLILLAASGLPEGVLLLATDLLQRLGQRLRRSVVPCPAPQVLFVGRLRVLDLRQVDGRTGQAARALATLVEEGLDCFETRVVAQPSIPIRLVRNALLLRPNHMLPARVALAGGVALARPRATRGGRIVEEGHLKLLEG